MQTTKSTPNRLLAYGSLALGSTSILATQADAATVVDINSTFYDTGLSGIGVIQDYSTSRNGYGKTYTTSSVEATGTVRIPLSGVFKRSTDTTPVTFSGESVRFEYADTSYIGGGQTEERAVNGAILNSSDNWFYAVDDVDGTQRLWLQFDFGNNDGTFSIVKAVIPGEGETIDNAAAASAVPESSTMALLALGATGLLIRRRREAA